ncbi:polyketide cyclase, partial [candidate division MSBL1 archaeon SCGC-AAA382C18]
FKTDGMTIDEIPMDWLYGDGVVVDLSDEMEELEVYTPEMIEERADIREGDILVLHTGWHNYGQYGDEADEEKYILKHPGAHPDMVDYLKEKNIKVWGVDAVSTDHPMDLPIGRFLGENTFGQCKEVRAQAEEKFGEEKLEELFPEEDYQLTHNELFPDDICHMENLGGDISAPEIQNKRIKIGCFPWKFKGGEAAFARVVAFLEE